MRAVLVAATVALAGGAASAQSVIVPAGPVDSTDRLMADSRRSDEGLIHSSSDLAGLYRFRPEARGAWVEMSLDSFEAHVRERLSDRTEREVPQFQDWVVRYMAADGRAFLWRAGLTAPATGRWELRRTPMHSGGTPFTTLQLCFSTAELDGYPQREPGPDGWFCDPASHLVAYPEHAAADGHASRDGDVFGLAEGRVPFVLQPDTRPEWPDEATK